MKKVQRQLDFLKTTPPRAFAAHDSAPKTDALSSGFSRHGRTGCALSTGGVAFRLEGVW